MQTLVINQTPINTIQYIWPFEDVSRSHLAGNCIYINILVEYQVTKSYNIQSRLALYRLDCPHQFRNNWIVRSLFQIQIDLTMIYDYNVSLFFCCIENLDIFIFLVDRTNEFKSYFVLKVDCEVSEKEYTFFYYFYVSLQNKILFNCGVHKL